MDIREVIEYILAVIGPMRDEELAEIRERVLGGGRSRTILKLQSGDGREVMLDYGSKIEELPWVALRVWFRTGEQKVTVPNIGEIIKAPTEQSKAELEKVIAWFEEGNPVDTAHSWQLIVSSIDEDELPYRIIHSFGVEPKPPPLDQLAN